MSKPFDATLNALIDLAPEAWADCFADLVKLPRGPSVPLDTDLATTIQADRVFRINAPVPWLLHLELEANPRTGIPADLSRYNNLISHRDDLTAMTVLILLRPKAFVSDMTGRFSRLDPNGDEVSSFVYRIEKVWERPVDFWLNRGVALAPLAMITDEAGGDLESALTRFRDCLRDSKTDETTEHSLLSSSYVLCGLRHRHEQVVELYRRLSMLLEDSTTYQEILQKGVSQGLTQGLSQGLTQGLSQGQTQGQRSLIRRQGTKKFGAPDAAISAALEAIIDAGRLERIAERMLDANSWGELLATP